MRPISWRQFARGATVIISKHQSALNARQAKLSGYKRVSLLMTRALAVLAACSFIRCGKLNNSVNPIRTVAAIHSLSEREIANGQRVELRGVVTLSDPGWRLLALQDVTGGVLVDWPPLERNLELGDDVALEGTTSLDNHVLSIVAASLRVVGRKPLPHPVAASADSIACGEILYRVVEVEFRPDDGALGDATHTARFSRHQRCNDLVAIGRFLRLSFPPPKLIGHRVRIRGVPLGYYSPSGRLTQVRLMFEDESDVDILDRLTADTSGSPASNLPEMRSLSAVKALPRTEAERGYPVRVEGVVTTPLNPRHNGYFLQDGPIGIYIHLPLENQAVLRSGQRVRIVGRTEKGGFAPVIRQSSLTVLGSAPMPKPVKIDPGDIFHGWEENLWVEVEGVATSVVNDAHMRQLELFAGPKRLLVWFSENVSAETLAPFINGRVLVRGVYSPLFTASGAWTGFRMFSESTKMLKLTEPAPSKEEFRSIASLSQFDPRGFPRHRFSTSGTVTYRDSRGRLYLQDGNSSLQVVGNGTGDPPPNTLVMLDGFLSPEAGIPPRVEHIRWISTKAGAEVLPAQILAESLTSGELQGRVVTVEGFLENRRTSGGQLQLELIAGRSRFAAYMEAPGSQNFFSELRPGALLRLTGVCATQAGQSLPGTALANLWLRNGNEITVVRRAPWWDLRRAMYAALAASALLILMLAWVARLRHNLVVQEEQLLHAQKLESIGRLAGGVAHDFNNYLTVVLGYTTMLLDQFPDNHTLRTHLSTIREVGEKTASLTRQLLAFSRKQVLQPVPCDVNEVINDAKSTLLPLIGEHIEIVMHLGKVDPVSIDPAQFLQVLINLAVNARDAMPKGGQLIFETETLELVSRHVESQYGLQPGRYVCIGITDTGVGMDRAIREHIFEPFFTTKAAHQGTGLGLAVVFGIVKQSKGHIEVQSKPGQGTRFRLYLPTVEHALPAKERQGPTKQRSGSETILVVEDQGAVRQLVCAALKEYGYVVLSADGPKQALAILANLSVSIDMLLTDLVMPEMSGQLLAAEAMVKRPGIRILFMSGYSEEIVAHQDAGGEQIDCLEKPFTPDQLAGAVRTVLDRVSA